MTRKFHGVCHSKGRPRRCTCMRGNAVTSLVLMGAEGLPPVAVATGDQGYDRDKIRKIPAEQGTLPCHPTPPPQEDCA